jgi:hypothetical protein
MTGSGISFYFQLMSIYLRVAKWLRGSQVLAGNLKGVLLDSHGAFKISRRPLQIHPFAALWMYPYHLYIYIYTLNIYIQYIYIYLIYTYNIYIYTGHTFQFFLFGTYPYPYYCPIGEDSSNSVWSFMPRDLVRFVARPTVSINGSIQVTFKWRFNHPLSICFSVSISTWEYFIDKI